MAKVCDRCGKGIQRGRKVSHSGVRTKKIFRPNLHTLWIVEGGHRVKKKLCTSCLRIIKKQQAEKTSKAEQVVQVR